MCGASNRLAETFLHYLGGQIFTPAAGAEAMATLQAGHHLGRVVRKADFARLGAGLAVGLNGHTDIIRLISSSWFKVVTLYLWCANNGRFVERIDDVRLSKEIVLVPIVVFFH